MTTQGGDRLTQEQVQDFAWAIATGALSYDDAGNAADVANNSIGSSRLVTEDVEDIAGGIVEKGTVKADGVDASNSAGMDSGGTATTTAESFAQSFAATPTIAASIIDSQDSSFGYIISIRNPSTTGFDMQFEVYNGTDDSGTTNAYVGGYVASDA